MTPASTERRDFAEEALDFVGGDGALVGEAADFAGGRTPKPRPNWPGFFGFDGGVEGEEVGLLR